MTELPEIDFQALMRVAHFVTPRACERPAISDGAYPASIEVVCDFNARPISKRKAFADTLDSVLFMAAPGAHVMTVALIKAPSGNLVYKPFQFVRFPQAEMEAAVANKLGRALKLNGTLSRKTAQHKLLIVHVGSAFSLNQAFIKGASNDEAGDILAGIGIISEFRADPITAAIFRCADGQLRAAIIEDKPTQDKALIRAIGKAVADHLKRNPRV